MCVTAACAKMFPPHGTFMISAFRDSTTLRYGASRHQVVTVRAPARGVDERDGTVVVLHGGSWRWPYGRAVMRLVVEDLRQHGWWIADVEYRRLGRFGGGGGFPETFDDVVDAIGTVEAHRSARTVVVGHSAGGHLALATAPRVSNVVDLAGVVAVAAPTDIRRIVETGQQDAIALTVGAPEDERWSLTSPMHMLPLGTPVALVHSRDDATVPARRSEQYADAAAAAGDRVQLRLVEGDTHRDAIKPSSATWSAARSAVSEFLG